MGNKIARQTPTIGHWHAWTLLENSPFRHASATRALRFHNLARRLVATGKESTSTCMYYPFHNAAAQIPKLIRSDRAWHGPQRLLHRELGAKRERRSNAIPCPTTRSHPSTKTTRPSALDTVPLSVRSGSVSRAGNTCTTRHPARFRLGSSTDSRIFPPPSRGCFDHHWRPDLWYAIPRKSVSRAFRFLGKLPSNIPCAFVAPLVRLRGLLSALEWKHEYPR